MLSNEGLDLGQNGLLFHGSHISRVITRTSTVFGGDYTKLRELTRAPIPWAMEAELEIDVDKLEADMAARVEKTSARKFSLAATGGSNPDFYRNFVNNGQKKRISAKVFLGIVTALERDPFDYVIGAKPSLTLPNATVLTNTFALLLDSLGIDPYQGERAQKLAAQFPDVLQSVATLHSQATAGQGQPPAEGAPAADEARSPA